MPPLLADFTHARPCKPFCEKYLTLPSGWVKERLIGEEKREDIGAVKIYAHVCVR